MRAERGRANERRSRTAFLQGGRERRLGAWMSKASRYGNASWQIPQLNPQLMLQLMLQLTPVSAATDGAGRGSTTRYGPRW